MKLKFWKKEKPEWELETIYQRAIFKLDGLEGAYEDCLTEAAREKILSELSNQRAYVQSLAKQKREWEQAQQKTKVSADTKVAATVTGIAALAPYMIERAGKLANHMKGKVNLPRMWK